MVRMIDRTATTEQRISMCYEEFLEAYPEHIHAEWVQGEAVIFMPPSTRHQYVADFVLILLRLFVELKGVGRVLSAPFQMRMPAQESAREPDILFVAAANRDRLTAQRLLGPADLVVEVVSDESVTRDNVEKWREYQAAGVREYWILDPRPEHQSAHFWKLDEFGRFATIPLDDSGVFRSHVLPGFWLDTHWLQGEELPNAMHCFLQIVGPDALTTG